MAEPDKESAPVLLFEQDDLIALSKPAGLDVFGESSLCSWLVGQRPGLARVGPAAEPAIVHRLDRGTSGLMLAALDQAIYEQLRSDFSNGRVQKTYLALVEGGLAEPALVDLPLGARYRRSKRVQVSRPGLSLRGVKPAQTRVEPLGQAKGFSLCRVEIHTGMRHQVRAHLGHLGHPVAGDSLYGASLSLPGLGAGFFLHAWRIGLPPARKTPGLICPLPARRSELLTGLGLLVPSWSEPEDP